MKSPVSTRKSKAAQKPAEGPKKAKVMDKFIALKPRISEKGYALSENANTYIFDVPSDVNKFDIAKAAAVQFEVEVTKVRLAGVPGKAVRSYRNRGRKFIDGQRSNVRKAYVTLKEGDKLPIFAAVEDPKAPEKENK